MKRAWILSTLVVQALTCSAAPTSGFRPPISDRLAIRAIIGEGANQSDAALAGIASAIHNRGTLHGVLGLRNPVVDTASAALWARATRAWTLAKAGGDPENIRGCKYFGCPTDERWFHKHGFTAVKTIGQITFYKQL
jgi:hypothetical protein